MDKNENKSERYWQNWDKGVASRNIDAYWRASEGPWRKMLVKDILSEFGKKTTLFEAGCGSGLIYKEMQRQGVIRPDTYTGGDISQSMLAIGRKRFPNVNFVDFDILNINYSDQSLPNVLSIHVIQHLPHYENAVKELLRVTGEKLYICSWFSMEPEEKLIYSEPSERWSGQSFHNNTYSLPKFLLFIASNSNREIKSLRVHNFFGQNYAITVSFEDHKKAPYEKLKHALQKMISKK